MPPKHPNSSGRGGVSQRKSAHCDGTLGAVRINYINGHTGGSHKYEKVQKKMKVNVKKPSVIAGILLTGGAMLMTTAALARGPGGEGIPDFATLDTNGDGVLTAAELESAKANRLGEVDANGDGFITADEMMVLMQARMAEQATKRFERMLGHADANDDGKLSV
jgi:hypothetical protein